MLYFGAIHADKECWLCTSSSNGSTEECSDIAFGYETAEISIEVPGQGALTAGWTEEYSKHLYWILISGAIFLAISMVG